MAVASARVRSLRYVAPIALVVALVAIAGVALLLALGSRDKEPARAGAFIVPEPAHPFAVVDVQQVKDGSLTVGDGSVSRDVRPGDGVTVYALRPTTAGEAQPGDWVTVIGIPNEVLNFTIRAVLIIPTAVPVQPDADGTPRLASGLAGHETTRDARERPLVAGRVTAVSGPTITLDAGGRTVTLDAGPAFPLRRLTPAKASDIRAGDRIAYAPASAGAGLDTASALLVLPATP